MTKPYFQNHVAALYLGDCREVLDNAPAADLWLADPPYGQTSLRWDRWPTGWLDVVNGRSLWCFGTLRMFLRHGHEFRGWSFAQDLVWQKQNGSNFHADRFRRIHETIAHFYRGSWESLYKNPIYTADATARVVRRKKRPPHTGLIGRSSYLSIDGGPRLQRSILAVRNCHGYAQHPTQKPLGILKPIIRYSCPRGGLVIVPFAGSGSEMIAAVKTHRRTIGVEVSERFCEIAAHRLEALS